MGIRNVVKYVWGSYADTLWFPSPCGEMGIRNAWNSTTKKKDSAVSVPLRGNGYKERGSVFREIYLNTNKFPSPCGEMGIRNSYG